MKGSFIATMSSPFLRPIRQTSRPILPNLQEHVETVETS